jgi:hypothetical protein
MTFVAFGERLRLWRCDLRRKLRRLITVVAAAAARGRSRLSQRPQPAPDHGRRSGRSQALPSRSRRTSRQLLGVFAKRHLMAPSHLHLDGISMLAPP